MFNLVKLLLSAAVILAVVGYFRGWYTIAQININKEQIHSDVDTFGKTAKDAASALSDKLSQGTSIQGTLDTYSRNGFVILTATGERSAFTFGPKLLSSANILYTLQGLAGKKVKVSFEMASAERRATGIESAP